VKKGSGFKFQCDYDNTQDKTLIFGKDLGQEMCVLFGMMWSLEPTQSNPPAVSCLGSKKEVTTVEAP